MVSRNPISGSNPIFEDTELVFGLVAPVGTDFEIFQNQLERTLEKYGYHSNLVRLSDQTDKYKPTIPRSNKGSKQFLRIHRKMHEGNTLRLTSEKGEFLALAAAAHIYSLRPKHVGSDGVLKKQVHVLRSLKHPDEVRLLRRIYGHGFFLVGINVEEEQRRKYLSDKLGCTPTEVEKLLARDEHEADPKYFGADGSNFGQRTRDTFHLSDVFLRLGDERALQRFVGLVFGCPFETPTQDEHSMFMAFASAARSADLSRQVGAVVVSENGDLVSTGANDVPRGGGGLYWPGSDDQRDHKHEGGKDSNAVMRDEMVGEILSALKPDKNSSNPWNETGKVKLKQTSLMDITEYGRAVHAEMEALMSCARSATSPRRGTLYSTTFPCHNCAKHIVAAGVSRVVYVEPYPKSQALRLFPDSIRLYGPTAPNVSDRRVVFEPFQGVGPRRFFDLFSMSLSWGTNLKRKNGSSKFGWQENASTVRVPLHPNTYMDREAAAYEELVSESKPASVDVRSKSRTRNSSKELIRKRNSRR